MGAEIYIVLNDGGGACKIGTLVRGDTAFSLLPAIAFTNIVRLFCLTRERHK